MNKTPARDLRDVSMKEEKKLGGGFPGTDVLEVKAMSRET